MAGGGDDQQVGQRLHGAQRPAVDARAGDQAREVLARSPPPRAHDVGEVGEQFAHHIDAVLPRLLQVRVARAQQLLRGAQDEGRVLLGQVEDGHDHRQREPHRDLAREVDLGAGLAHAGDGALHHRADLRLEAPHARAHEPGLGELAELAVLRLVHVDERAHALAAAAPPVLLARAQPIGRVAERPLREPGERGQHLERLAHAAGHGRRRLLLDVPRDQAEPRLVDEELVLALDGEDVLMAQHGPERPVRVAVDPGDRRLAAQAREIGVEGGRVGVARGRGDVRVEHGAAHGGHHAACPAALPAMPAVACSAAR